MLARIVLTPGDPAGIGPDIVAAVAQLPIDAELIVVGDIELMAQRALRLSLPLKIDTFSASSVPLPHQPGSIQVLPVSTAATAQAGMLDAQNAAYVLKTLDRAIELCRQDNNTALVTGPVHKGIINQAGYSFSGHTEYLAAKTNSPQPVMMLQTEGLRVALATTHLPLREVSDAITRERLASVLSVIQNDFKTKFAIADPEIFVCGLNPHAGEDGHLGTEEIEIINPVIEQFQQQGWHISGPLAADTIFGAQNLAKADVFLAMYHDQGLPVLKYKGFSKAVNITLGLPFVRTSVDHGTALELAGSGNARSHSLQLALQTAIDMVNAGQ